MIRYTVNTLKTKINSGGILPHYSGKLDFIGKSKNIPNTCDIMQFKKEGKLSIKSYNGGCKFEIPQSIIYPYFLGILKYEKFDETKYSQMLSLSMCYVFNFMKDNGKFELFVATEPENKLFQIICMKGENKSGWLSNSLLNTNQLHIDYDHYHCALADNHPFIKDDSHIHQDFSTLVFAS